MKSKKSAMFLTLFIPIILLMVVVNVFAQDKPEGYPTRAIEVVVIAGPGGGSDIFSRTICMPARRTLGVPVVVVNKPGGAMVLGTEYVLNKPADGYTLLGGTVGSLISNGLQGLATYQYTDFQPIIRVQHDTMAMEVLPEGKYKSIHDVIADAKARPGEQIWGTVGSPLSSTSILIKQFTGYVGINVRIVPYDSTGKQHAALLGGHVDAILDEPGPVSALVAANKMKLILVFAEEIIPRYPDVPATKELGAPVYQGLSRGMVVKKGTPMPIVNYLHDAFKKAMETSFYKSYESSQLLDLRPGYLGPDDFFKFMEEEAAFYTRVYKEMGVYKIREK